jgi:hypothetical protein
VNEPLSTAAALAIARADAERAYRDLSVYAVSIERSGDAFRVDYVLINRNLSGGGPHYVIDAQSGRILSKRYGQ